ncbi:MAG: tetratricopeptide repeat protein, partial [Chloroflexaceae bacterium]|nr:tetratricopeptide repeat protein [Chloroflexaceae bacterium]
HCPQGRLAARGEGYQQVLSREPDNQTALRGLLEVRLQQGNLGAAAELLEELAALNPQEVGYALLSAQAKRRLGDSEAALVAYRGIVSARPELLEVWQEAIDLFAQEQRLPEALELLETTLASQPSQPSDTVLGLKLLLGFVNGGLNRYGEAISIYDQLLPDYPDDYRPLFSKALALSQQGQEQAAQPLFQRAAELAPPEFRDQIRAYLQPEINPEATSSDRH